MLSSAGLGQHPISTVQSYVHIPPLLYHQSEPSAGLWLFLANPMSVVHPEFSAIFHAQILSRIFLAVIP